VNTLEEKKGEDILFLDLREIATFTDYFILCTATSSRMILALADAVIEQVRKKHERKGALEGKGESGWLVIDYGDLVLHLFNSKTRRYYRLEELWKDGKTILRVQ
jgi:ribosome-associated protein